MSFTFLLQSLSAGGLVTITCKRGSFKQPRTVVHVRLSIISRVFPNTMERKRKRNKHKKKTTTEKNTKVIPGCFFLFFKQDDADNQRKRENYRKLQIILHSILVGCRKQYCEFEGGKQQQPQCHLEIVSTMTKDEQKKGQNKPAGKNRESKCDLEKLDNESCNSEVLFPSCSFSISTSACSYFCFSKQQHKTRN